MLDVPRIKSLFASFARKVVGDKRTDEELGEDEGADDEQEDDDAVLCDIIEIIGEDDIEEPHEEQMSGATSSTAVAV